MGCGAVVPGAGTLSTQPLVTVGAPVAVAGSASAAPTSAAPASRVRGVRMGDVSRPWPSVLPHDTMRFMDAVTTVPVPTNEPVRQYAPGTTERTRLEARLKDLAAEQAELTMTIGGTQRFGGGEPIDVVQPHRHSHVLGTMRNATNADV